MESKAEELHNIDQIKTIRVILCLRPVSGLSPEY